MEIIENKEFNQFIEKYKQLDLKDKQTNIISLLKEDILVLQKILTDNDKEKSYKILYNREILDVNNETYTEDDFSEAVIVYLYAMRELLAELIEKGGF